VETSFRHRKDTPVSSQEPYYAQVEAQPTPKNSHTDDAWSIVETLQP